MHSNLGTGQSLVAGHWSMCTADYQTLHSLKLSSTVLVSSRQSEVHKLQPLINGLCPVSCIVSSLQSTTYSAQSTVCSLMPTSCCTQPTAYILHYTLRSTVYRKQFAVYTDISNCQRLSREICMDQLLHVCWRK